MTLQGGGVDLRQHASISSARSAAAARAGSRPAAREGGVSLQVHADMSGAGRARRHGVALRHDPLERLAERAAVSPGHPHRDPIQPLVESGCGIEQRQDATGVSDRPAPLGEADRRADQLAAAKGHQQRAPEGHLVLERFRQQIRQRLWERRTGRLEGDENEVPVRE